MKKALIAALGFLSVGVLAIPVRSADAQVRPSPTPSPIIKVAPQFNCSALVNGTSGTAIVSKSNAATIDKTHDIVVTVQTPSGKVSAATCGSAFSSNAVGTKVNVPFTQPPTTDKSFIYTCSASVAETTSACNPPK